MKTRIFIYSPIKEQANLVPNAEKTHYLKNVLRMKTGDEVFVFNSEDGEFEARVIAEGRDFVLKVGKRIKQIPEIPKKIVNLVIANIKNAPFSDILNACTQIGVMNFFPIITKNTVVHNFNLDRGNKIIEEACEQSGRVCMPKLHKLQKFDEILSNILPQDKIIFCDEKSANKKNDILNDEEKIFIFIGPEGGFSEDERERLINKGAYIMSLGSFILRAETAAICASFTICNS